MKPSAATMCLALLLLIGAAQAPAQVPSQASVVGIASSPAPTTEMIDATVRATIRRYQLPGIAVGVIEDGRLVFARGYGETVHGSGDPITRHTLFKIASNSKAMTAALLARLVQQGKLQWNDPVVKYLPEFAMHDAWVTAHMTVNDLLVHNSGLPEGGGDLMLWPEPNAFTRDDIVHGLRYIKPAYGFRAGYAYDNLLYVVAGKVAEAAGGATYEALIQRELFEPLGLHDCKVGAFVLREAGSVAQPHGRDGDKIVPTRPDPAQVPRHLRAAFVAAWTICWCGRIIFLPPRLRNCNGCHLCSAPNCGRHAHPCPFPGNVGSGTTPITTPMPMASGWPMWMGSGRSRIPAPWGGCIR